MYCVIFTPAENAIDALQYLPRIKYNKGITMAIFSYVKTRVCWQEVRAYGVIFEFIGSLVKNEQKTRHRVAHYDVDEAIALLKKQHVRSIKYYSDKRATSVSLFNTIPGVIVTRCDKKILRNVLNDVYLDMKKSLKHGDNDEFYSGVDIKTTLGVLQKISAI